MIGIIVLSCSCWCSTAARPDAKLGAGRLYVHHTAAAGGDTASSSLPGIAGIILSVGMAVDANVIIFERFKEELATGKTLRASLNAGFHKAMSTIIDSNITTIIAAIVIAIFGVGTVKGFGYTLIMGIVVSMFTALVITRALMKLAIALNIKNPKLYSSRKIAPEKSLKGGE